MSSEPAQLNIPGHTEEHQHRSLWMDVWIQYRKHKGAMLGTIILLFLILAVTFGPMIYTVSADEINLQAINASGLPWQENFSWSHPFGADNLGRDTLARCLVGGRISIAVGLSAMLIALVVGTTVGILAGYYPMLDGPLMRITDMFFALPLLPLLLVVILLFRDSLRQIFGPEWGIFILIVSVIGILNWMPTARVVRGDVLALKEQEFVTAAVSIGTRSQNILLRHIFPNVLSPIMVSATLGIANAILTESALSFLGLGFPSDFPTWGRVLFDGLNFIQITPMLVFWPGLLISLTVLSVNFIGNGLRDALDPRLRGR